MEKSSLYRASSPCCTTGRHHWLRCLPAVCALWFLMGGADLFAAQLPRQDTTLQIPNEWIAYNRNGLVVPHPPGWTVAAGAAGSFLATRAETKNSLSALVYVRPLDGQKATDSQSRLELLGRLEPDLFAGIKLVDVETVSQVPDVAVARYVYAKQGKPYKAVALCFQHQGRGVVYVMAAQEHLWSRHQSDMLTMLRTFFYSPLSSGAPPALPAMVVWHDMVEGAFTISVPKGWSVQGGVRRTSALQVDMEAVMVNPAQTIALRIGDANIPHMQLPEALGPLVYAEGTWRQMSDGASRLYVWHYLPGAQFLKDFYLPNKFPQASDVQVQDHPELAAKVYRQRAASFYPLPVRFDLGEIRFSATIDGHARRGRFYALTWLMDQSALLGHPSGMWNVDGLVGYVAAPEQEELAHAILDHVTASMRIDPVWQQRQAQLSRQATGVNLATQSEINELNFKSYQERSGMYDRAHEAQIQSIRGTLAVRDPETRKVIEVPVGSNYYWLGGAGDTVIGTETASPSELPSGWLGRLLEKAQ